MEPVTKLMQEETTWKTPEITRVDLRDTQETTGSFSDGIDGSPVEIQVGK